MSEQAELEFGEVLENWTVPLPFQTPLSLNDRMGHWAKAHAVAKWREASTWAIKGAGIPHCRLIRVQLRYYPKVDRRRDPDNLVASMKPVCDALIDAGVVDDDTQDYVERKWPWIMPKLPTAPDGRFDLVVEQLD
jgi:crossover junction endodeoxyribonuclease RusA